MHSRFSRRFHSRTCRVMAFSAVLLLPVAGLASPDSPGYVDSSFLMELASDEGTIVEVTLDEQLLRLLAGPAGAFDAEVGEIAAQLDSVKAVVVELRDDLRETALSELQAIHDALAVDGWQNVARVRDGKDHVFVMLKNDGETLVGVTVMVLSDRELVFTNVAGRIDMAQLTRLASKLDIPGLDALAGGR